MKSIGFALSVVLMSLCTLSVGQSDAQKSFDKLKTLAGSWEGQVTTVPPQGRHRRQADAGYASRHFHG